MELVVALGPRLTIARDAAAASIIVVSASETWRRSVADKLADAGYRCHPVQSIAAAVSQIAAGAPRLVIVEGRQGPRAAAALCPDLQRHADCPILVIDQGDDVIDRVLALELGADDYLSHPVHDRELFARIKALLRRRAGPITGSQAPSASSWRLDFVLRQLTGPHGAAVVVLTPCELSLLGAFLRQPGVPLTATEISRLLAEPAFSTARFRTYMVRLRRKLASAGFQDTVIRSLRLNGYVFDLQVAEAGIVHG